MNDPAPRVSIGMPVRNGAVYIESAIQSILDQDHTDFELVVSDNGSTDDTPEIVRRMAAGDPRIRYVRQETDQGAAWNHNEVFRLRHPGAEFFKWAAADDRHRPGYLLATVALLDRRPDVVLAHSGTVDVSDGLPDRATPPPPAGDVPDVAERFGAYVRYRHEAFQGFGLVRAAVAARTPMLAPFTDSDLSYLAELSLYGCLVDVDEVLFERRVHPDQSTSAYRTRRHRMSWFDPAAAGRVWVLPTALMARELLRAVERAPLTARERRRCRRRLLGWAWDSKLRLANDITTSVREAARRAAAGTRSAR